MSQITAEPGKPLSDVLSRIHALTQQDRARPALPEDTIPRLMESYDGHQSLQFIDVANTQLPTLSDAVDEAEPGECQSQATAYQSSPGETRTHDMLTTARQQQLLSEMEPVIKAAIQKAILSELGVIEKALKTKLEQNLMEALKQRISSGQY